MSAAAKHPILHPTFAAILATAAQVPAQIERAEYVSRIKKMDWQFERADCGASYRAGKAELAALVELRERLDPGHVLWNRHAPEHAWVQQPVHTFRDFTGNAPVTVEWVATADGPRVIAVVVDAKSGVHSIQQDLSAAALARYQAQAEKVAATQAAGGEVMA